MAQQDKDYQSYIYHKLQERDSNWITEWFCRRKKITRHDMTNHPCWGDLVLLINVYGEFGIEIAADKKLRNIYDKHWNVVYHLKHRLNDKGLRNIERLVQGSIRQRNKTQQQRQTIANMRIEKSNQNKGYDMTAKEPNLPVKVSIREQQGGREELSSALPW